MIRNFAMAVLLAGVALSAPLAHAADEKAPAKKTAKAQQAEGIAAVVNSDAITMSDVYDRMKLMIVSSGMPNTPDIQERLKNQVLNMLIEESLQMQEARSANITITPEEVAGGLTTIAKNNNLELDRFRAMLQNDGIRIRTLENQVRAQLAWGRVVQRKLRKQVDVSESDIDERQRFLESSIGKQQYQVAQIFLPLDSGQQEAEVQALAQRLTREITERRAPFPQVAQQFSQEAAAARGGDLGWVQEGELPEQLNQALATMKEGDLSDPIRTVSGYHILLLRGKRTVSAENIPDREQILNQIGTERLDRVQRRHLMDLKAEAFVDRRV